MIGKLIVSHGGLAQEFLSAVIAVTGGNGTFEALCLDWNQGIEEARREIAQRVRKLDQGDGVLILTAMFGDTPANASLSLLKPGKVEMVAGINLPMVVRLGCMPTDTMPLPELVKWIESKGRTSIRGVSEAPGGGAGPVE